MDTNKQVARTVLRGEGVIYLLYFVLSVETNALDSVGLPRVLDQKSIPKSHFAETLYMLRTPF